MNRYQLFSIVMLGFFTVVTQDTAYALYGIHGEENAAVDFDVPAKNALGVAGSGIVQGQGSDGDTESDTEDKPKTKKRSKNAWLTNAYKSKKRKRSASPSPARLKTQKVEKTEADEDDDEKRLESVAEDAGISEEQGDDEDEGEEKFEKEETSTPAEQAPLQEQDLKKVLVAAENGSDEAAALLLKDAIKKNPGVLARLKNVFRNPLSRSVRHVGEVAGAYHLSNTIMLCTDMAVCWAGPTAEIVICGATGGFVVIALTDLGFTLYDLVRYAISSKDGNTDLAHVREKAL